MNSKRVYIKKKKIFVEKSPIHINLFFKGSDQSISISRTLFHDKRNQQSYSGVNCIKQMRIITKTIRITKNVYINQN